jgi:hypothetical protein
MKKKQREHIVSCAEEKGAFIAKKKIRRSRTLFLSDFLRPFIGGLLGGSFTLEV